MARRPTKTSKAKQGSKTRAKSKPKPKEPLLSGVSPQRRVDIFAIIFLLIGTLTLISLFTQTSGSVTGWWVKNLSLVMGWGVYILPLALIIMGAWMLFRNMEHLPRLSPERTVGIILLFVNLTAWFHLLIDGGFPEAALGRGGGYVGSAIKLGLVRTLGKPGAIVALVAWLLISLILTLDLVMANILKWFGVLFKNLGQKIQAGFARIQTQLRARREARKQTTQAVEGPMPAEPPPNRVILPN
jgi:DNA segregation ATPase FtsK/SpoIIIE, S-DNA-T family